MQTDAAIPWEGEVETADDEAALVRAAQQDAAAFAPLYRRYRQRVYAYLCARLTNAEDAADLTQQVFLQALTALPRYRPSAVPFGVWLVRIARNAATDLQRRRQRDAVTGVSVPDEAQPRAEHDVESEVLQRDASLARSLQVQAQDSNRRSAASRQVKRAWVQMPRRAAGWRLASLSLAVLAAVGGTGVFLRAQSPTPVNAQNILHRAAAVSPGPNQATHSIYQVSTSGGYTGAADVWVGTSAVSTPTEFALTLRMSKGGKPALELSSQRVLTDQTMQVYDPASNTVTISSPGGSDQQLEGMFVGVLVAQKLNRALGVGTQPNAFNLQQQTLDGVSVYALKLDDSTSQTFW